MAHTNETTNYGLSQFLGTDKPAWLVDYNGDNLKIDAAMKDISDVADAAKTKADNNEIAISSVTTTANAADVRSTAAISNTADVYDATSTYAVGEHVIYNNLLYRCTTAINVPEAFDGTKWTRTTLEEITDAINSDLSVLKYKAGDVLTLNDDYFFGHAGGNSTSLVFVLTTNKEIPTNLNETVSLSVINVVANGTFTTINLGNVSYTLTTYKRQSEILIRIDFSGTTPLPTTINNHTCTVRASGTVAFS